MSNCLWGPAGTYAKMPSCAVPMRPLGPRNAKLRRSLKPASPSQSVGQAASCT